MEIGIFHNNNDGAKDSGYSAGDTLTEVYRLVAEESFATGRELAVFEWFCLTAAGATWPRHRCSLDYLARGNRSLRTGDVIEIDGVFYARTPRGFVAEIEDGITPSEIAAAARPATVPFSAPVIPIDDPLGRSVLSMLVWATELAGQLADNRGGDGDFDAEAVLKAVLSWFSASSFKFSRDREALIEALFAGTTTSRRLTWLRTLVDEEASENWRNDYVAGLLAQHPHAPDPACPRYAGIVTESGDRSVIAADTLDELRDDMAGRATSGMPVRPVAMVDLDTRERRDVLVEAVVWFDGEENPLWKEDGRTQ